MFTDEGQITDKSKLPIQAWSYGPLSFQNEKMAVTIGSLRCDPKASESEEKSLKMKVFEHGNAIIQIEQDSSDNLSTIKTLINTKESTIRHDMVNLHDKTRGKIDDLKADMELFVIDKVNESEALMNTTEINIRNDMVDLHAQMEVGTKSEIDSLKSNMKVFVIEKINASETIIDGKIQNLEETVELDMKTKTDNLKAALESHVQRETDNLKTSLESYVNEKTDIANSSTEQNIKDLKADLKNDTIRKIDSLKANLKSHIQAEIRTSESSTSTNIQTLENALKQDTNTKIGNLKTTLETKILAEIYTLKTNSEKSVNDKIATSKTFIHQNIQNLETDTKTKIDTVKTALESHVQAKIHEVKTAMESHVDSKVNTFENSIQESIRPLESDSRKLNCPENDDVNYAFIGDICYFFEINSKNYQDAKANCESKFGNRVGQLFEPKSLERNNQVHNKAKLVSTSKNWWIGVSDSETEGSYQYETTRGIIPFELKTAPWHSTQPNGETSKPGENCIVIISGQPEWHDFACSNNFHSICEST